MSRNKNSYQVTFEGEAAEVVKATANLQGVDIPESLKRTIATYDFLQEQVLKGCNIKIVNPLTHDETLLALDGLDFAMWEAQIRE